MIRQNDILGDELLTREQVAKWLGLEAHTLACWRCSQKGPPMVKFGSGRSSAVRYRRSAVEAWLTDHEAEITATRTKPSAATPTKPSRTRQATAKRSRSR